MKKLTIHAGIHRTGTTILQKNLASLRPSLLSRDVFYPGEEDNHQSLAWGLINGSKNIDDVLEALKGGASHIVVSAEDFSLIKNFRWLRILSREYKISVIFYLRRQDHWIMSWYNQNVKWPFSERHSRMNAREFMACSEEFWWIHYERLLERWIGVVGRDAITVRIMEKGQVEDVLADFLSYLAIPGSDEFKIQPRGANDSLPVEALEIAIRLDLFSMKGGRRGATVRYLRELFKELGSNKKTLYSATERTELLARYASGNQWVARTFFDRDQLFLEGGPDDRDYYRQGSLRETLDLETVLAKTGELLHRGIIPARF